MKNRYEIRGDKTIIFINRKNGEVVETTISTSALKRADEYEGTWCVRLHYGKYYVRANVWVNGHTKRTSADLHVWLMQPQNGEHIDHIDRNPLNNTWDNLRFVTHGENMQNKDVYVTNNHSGLRDVHWDKKQKMWRVVIRVNNKAYRIGRYKDLDYANKIATEFRIRHMRFSQDALMNDPDPAFDFLNDINYQEGRKNKSSTYVGVHWCNSRKKYIARYTINKKMIKVGEFDDERVASIARDIALFNHYGPNLPGGAKFNHADIFHSSTVTWSTVDNFTSHTVDAHVV